MLRLLLVGLQTLGPADGWTLTKPAGPDLHATHRCSAGPTGDDVVVCGDRDPERYRLKPLPQQFERPGGMPMAQIRVGGSTLGVTAQSGQVGNVSTNRVMATLKVPF